jgi:16S rRNA (guanine527-N7)-methyltransferase
VKQHLFLSDLIHFLEQQNIILNDTQTQQLELYHSGLTKYADQMNLISTRDKSFIIEHHFLPSFYYYHYLSMDENFSDKHILDLGTGAGFPGIIIAISSLNNRITLIDSSRKKTLFLRNLVSRLELDIEIICERIENISSSFFKKYDIIVARAVASLSVLSNWCMPFLKTDGYLLTLKGENYKDELDRNLDIELNRLNPNPVWYNFSNYLRNKCMIKVCNH